MDNKKNDWKSEKSQSSDMSSCGCGGGTTGTGYAASDSMNASSASSMKDKSSDQFKDQGYKGSESKSMYKQKDKDNVSGKSCKADSQGSQSDMDNDVVYIETITAIYGPDDMDDSDYMDQDQNKDLNRKLNDNSEDLTDM